MAHYPEFRTIGEQVAAAADDRGGEIIELAMPMAPPQMNDDYHHIAIQCFQAGRADLALAAAAIDIAESLREIADNGLPDSPEQRAQRQAWLNRLAGAR